MARQATYPAAMRIAQLLKILLESYYGLISFADIRERLDISRKTLGRYLDVLEATFGDLIAVKTGSEVGRTPAGERFLVFKRYELEGRTGYQLAPLYLSRFFMSFLEGTLLDESLGEAVSLFEASVEQPKSGIVLGPFGKKFYAVGMGPKSYADHDEIIETLLKALIKQNPVEIGYKKPKAESVNRYLIRPLSMLIYKQGLYIIGDNDDWENPHFFAIERIKTCRRELAVYFDYPADFSPQKFCSGSFGIYVEHEVDVRIRFSPNVAGEYIQARRWHPSQEIRKLDDGGLELSMRVNGTKELFSWVLGFGGEAEVLAPAELREQIQSEINLMTKIYS